jgi:hypothetical protein
MGAAVQNYLFDLAQGKRGEGWKPPKGRIGLRERVGCWRVWRQRDWIERVKRVFLGLGRELGVGAGAEAGDGAGVGCGA